MSRQATPEEEKLIAETYKKREAQANSNPLNLNVTVDSQQVLDLLEDKKNLQNELKEAKNENITEVKQFFDLMKNNLAEKYEREGLAVPKVDSVQDLQNAEKNLKVFQQKGNFGTAQGGSAQLNSAQYGISEQRQGTYANHEQLVNDLILKEKVGSKSEKIAAKLALDEMTMKVVKGAKLGKIESFDFPKNESIVEKVNESYRRKILAQRGNQQ
jgi:hypothetical protein